MIMRPRDSFQTKDYDNGVTNLIGGPCPGLVLLRCTAECRLLSSAWLSLQQLLTNGKTPQGQIPKTKKEQLKRHKHEIYNSH